MATGKGGGMNAAMMELMAQMGGGQQQGGKKASVRDDESTGVSYVDTDNENAYPKQYMDIRKSERFTAPSKRKNSKYQTDKLGVDPFYRFLQKSTPAKGQPDLTRAASSLFAAAEFSPNFTPLHDVLSKSHWTPESKNQVLALALEYGANPNQTTGYPPESPLQRAIATGNRGGITVLVSHGADLNKPNLDGEAALNLVIQKGMPDLIPLMVSRGAKAKTDIHGSDLMDTALLRFQDKVSNTLARDKDYESAFNEVYQSMAYIKKYKLHKDDDFIFDKYKEKLIKLTSSKPSYAASINSMEEALKEVKPLNEIPKYEKPKAFTNPGSGLNDPIATRFNHSWLEPFALYRAMDNMLERMEREDIMTKSLDRVQSLSEEMQYLSNPNFLKGQMLQRKEVSLDLPIPKNNPHSDTLLTKAIREQNYSAVQGLVFLDVNLHSTDKYGNTGLHILAETCTNKEDFIQVLSQMIGTPGKDPDERTSLFEHGHMADWHIANADGKTFMDVLQDAHPEWKKDAAGKWPADCWFDQIEKQLGIKAPDTSVPQWNLQQGLLLGVDAPKLVLQPVADNATPSEKRMFIDNAFKVLTDTKHLELTSTSESAKNDYSAKFAQALDNCDATTKIGIVTGLLASTHIDEHTREQTLVKVVASFTNELKNAPDGQQVEVLGLYDKMTNNIIQSESLSPQLASSLLIQDGILSGNKDLEDMGRTVENILHTQALKLANEQGLSQNNDDPNKNSLSKS